MRRERSSSRFASTSQNGVVLRRAGGPAGFIPFYILYQPRAVEYMIGICDAAARACVCGRDKLCMGMLGAIITGF